MKFFEKAFFYHSIENQSFLESLKTSILPNLKKIHLTSIQSLIDLYAKEWNKSFSLPISQLAILEKKTVFQQVEEVQEKYSEIVKSTPFDLTFTYQERIIL